MKTNLINVGNIQITEIISDDILLKNDNDVLTVMGEVQSSFIVFYEHNVAKEFFDLSTRVAGNILQKFTNYRINIAVVGDFENYPSKTLKDFIYESNKTKDHLFVKLLDDAIRIWEERSSILNS